MGQQKKMLIEEHRNEPIENGCQGCEYCDETVLGYRNPDCCLKPV